MNIPLLTTLALCTAFILGGAIGFERQWRQRTAGLRTNVLVAVGAGVIMKGGAGAWYQYRSDAIVLCCCRSICGQWSTG